MFRMDLFEATLYEVPMPHVNSRIRAVELYRCAMIELSKIWVHRHDVTQS
jgi:hypothetical protein